MGTSLFRAEALQAQSAQHLGIIRIATGPWNLAAAAAATALAVAAGTLAVAGEFARKVRVPGLLVPAQGLLQITPLAAGTVVERRAREGDQVQAGQVLFVIDTDRAAPSGPVAARIEQALQARERTLLDERALRGQQAWQRTQALNERERALRIEAQQADEEAALVLRRVALAERSAQRYQDLVGKGFVSEAQAQAREEEWLDLQARAQAAQRARGGLQREMSATQAERSAVATQLQTEQAQIDRALASLRQDHTENDSRRQLLVTAPQDGTLTALHGLPGAPVQPGQTLATLVPGPASQGAPNEPALRAELYAPSRTAGFIVPGQEVWLRYAAFAYAKFGMGRGHVTHVSQTPVNPQDLPAGQAAALLLATQSQEPLYRIGVALDATPEGATTFSLPLKPGMALEADIAQERRALWEWLLEPLLAARAQAKVLSNTPNPSRPGG